MAGLDPVKAAHRSLCGVPHPQQPTSPTRCARCADQDADQLVTAVVSAAFTGFDSWLNPRGKHLCAACAWAYRTSALRMHAYYVTTTPACSQLTPSQLFATLAAGAVPAGTAVSVPLRPGRKHLVPHLEWGTVRVDDLNLVWTPADAVRLITLRQLRDVGFGPRSFTHPSPPWDVLRRQAAGDWAALQEAWATLDPWRTTKVWLALGLVATKENP